jgi:hypothetical protein
MSEKRFLTVFTLGVDDPDLATVEWSGEFQAQLRRAHVEILRMRENGLGVVELAISCPKVIFWNSCPMGPRYKALRDIVYESGLEISGEYLPLDLVELSAEAVYTDSSSEYTPEVVINKGGGFYFRLASTQGVSVETHAPILDDLETYEDLKASELDEIALLYIEVAENPKTLPAV